MAVVDEFVGRVSPVTKHPVKVTMLRHFDQKTLQDVWAIQFVSGNKMEEYSGLTPQQARTKWDYAKAWWG